MSPVPSRQAATTRSIASGASFGPSARMTTAAFVAGDSAASPQRNEAPGPRCQSAQRTTRASVSTAWAPTTTTISSIECALRTRSSTGSSRSRCFGDPKRDEAPAARTTAETMAHIVHTRVTDTSGFPSYARRGEEAGYALDHASTSNEAPVWTRQAFTGALTASIRSEEHTSELQSHVNLVCRLLLEKKKTKKKQTAVRVTKTNNKN